MKGNNLYVFILFILFSCNGGNQVNEENEKLDILYGSEKIGYAYVSKDNITDLKDIWIKPAYENKICKELVVITDSKRSILLAKFCKDYDRKNKFSIVHPLGLDEHFEKIGFKSRIDSLKNSPNYDSLKKRGDKLLDSLVNTGDLHN